jgi:hypothetical protein
MVFQGARPKRDRGSYTARKLFGEMEAKEPGARIQSNRFPPKILVIAAFNRILVAPGEPQKAASWSPKAQSL